MIRIDTIIFIVVTTETESIALGITDSWRELPNKT